MTKLRILQISTSLLPTPPIYGGAIESYVYGLSKALSTLGHEVHIIGVPNRKADYGEIYFHEVKGNKGKSISRNFHLPGGSVNLLELTSTVKEIARAVRSLGRRFDIVHCHYLDTALGYLMAERLAPSGVKTFLHLHNVPDVTFANRYPVFWAMNSFDGILVVSGYVRSKVSNIFPSLSGKTSVVYNAVDPNEFRCRDVSNDAIELPDGVRMLYVGRIVKQKGLHYVVDAMALLKKRGKLNHLHLLVVGPHGGFGEYSPSPYARHVKELCAREGLTSRIHFIGNLDRNSLIRVYRSSDFLVAPSCWGEPCGTVVLEAMACSKPVIAFRDGGIPELVEDGVTGLLVNLGDTEALADAVASIEKDIELRLIMGRSAAARINGEFSYIHLARQLAAIYGSYGTIV